MGPSADTANLSPTLALTCGADGEIHALSGDLARLMGGTLSGKPAAGTVLPASASTALTGPASDVQMLEAPPPFAGFEGHACRWWIFPPVPSGERHVTGVLTDLREPLMALALESSELGVLVQSEDGAQVAGNAAYRKIVDGNRFRETGLPTLDEDLTRAAEAQRALVASGWRPAPHVFRRVLAGGAVVAVEAESTLFTFEGRRFVVSYMRDVSDRESALAARAAADRRFRTVLEAAPDGIIITSESNSRITFANAAAAGMVGLPGPAALLDHTPISLLAPENIPHAIARGAVLRARGVAEPAEIPLRRGDGSVVHLEVRSQTIDPGDGPAVVSILRDMTTRREMEERLHSLERITELGMLAAGIAHEINNPLTSVMANLGYLMELGTEDDDTNDALVQAVGGARRVAEIVRGLKSFSRVQPSTPGPVNVAAALRVALSLTRNDIRHRATVVQQLGRIPPVLATEGSLVQCLVNLLANAAHAIPVGSAALNTITVRVDALDQRVVISVSDTGSGMTAEVRRRIFEPFFTTRAGSGGTGLGLPLTRHIVEEFGGELQVESEPGRGSTFRILLPVAVGAQFPAAAPRRRATPRRRVLIIDDEPVVASALRRLLGPFHDVEVASSGEAALERLGLQQPDVVLLDVMMPSITGRAVYEHMQRRFPAAASRVVFMTGGVLDEEYQAFLDAAGRPVMDKPVELATLLEQIDAVAGRGQAA